MKNALTHIACIFSAAATIISGSFCLSPEYASAGGRGGRVSVRGYYRSNGTYVRPHTRSAPGGGSSSYGGSGYPYSINGGNIGYSSESISSNLFSSYMKWGYEASARNSYYVALYWFEKALAERPGNPDAIKAVQNFTSTLLGETLVEQVARVKVESPCL